MQFRYEWNINLHSKPFENWHKILVDHGSSGMVHISAIFKLSLNLPVTQSCQWWSRKRSRFGHRVEFQTSDAWRERVPKARSIIKNNRKRYPGVNKSIFGVKARINIFFCIFNETFHFGCESTMQITSHFLSHLIYPRRFTHHVIIQATDCYGENGRKSEIFPIVEWNFEHLPEFWVKLFQNLYGSFFWTIDWEKCYVNRGK
jgi:hypothetical protein